MSARDYYKTLELPVSATAAEIKQAYRRLARHYHPDKNDDDARATRFFQEIQAAYEVLSDPSRRMAYDQTLKQAGQYSTFRKEETYNPEQIVKQTRSLLQYVSTMDQRSLNYDALTDFILGILSSENILLLQRAGNEAYNEAVTQNLLEAGKGILATRSFREIALRLESLHAPQATAMKALIQEQLDNRIRREQQNKRVPYAALAIICLFILIMCFILFY